MEHRTKRYKEKYAENEVERYRQRQISEKKENQRMDVM